MELEDERFVETLPREADRLEEDPRLCVPTPRIVRLGYVPLEPEVDREDARLCEEADRLAVPLLPDLDAVPEETRDVEERP